MKNSGFSLVELIVVIAVMAILVGVAVPVYTSYVQEAQDASDREYLADLKTATQVFAAENQIEVGSVVVGPTVTESQGITLFLTDGSEYEGDISALYEIVGAYTFLSDITDKTIVVTPEATLPEQSQEVSEDSESAVSDEVSEESEECEHEFGEPELRGNLEVYTCIHCGHETGDPLGENLGGTK